jgi:hypothetical protein
VENDAKQAVLRNNGDLRNRLHVLGQYTFQFSRFRDCSFKWVVENALGMVFAVLIHFSPFD